MITAGWPCGFNRARVAAEHGDELVVDDLHERLTGIQAARHFLAERAVADSVDERLGHRQRDVCLEQRHANGPHGVADVVLGDPAAAGDALERLGEARRQLIEHAGTLGCDEPAWAEQSLACASRRRRAARAGSARGRHACDRLP